MLIILILLLFSLNLESSPSYQGFRGVVNTPNAKVVDEGEFEFLYTNQVENFYSYQDFDYIRDTKSQDNFFLNMGVLPNLDISLRYSQGRGEYSLEDRMISLKYKIPFIPYNIFDVALGMQDIGGGAEHLKSRYIVFSKKKYNFYYSLGYGDGESIGALDGIFGSIEYQPFSWLEIGGEYDTHEYNGVVKSNFQIDIRKEKIKLGLMVKRSLTYNKSYFGGYINFPFNNKNKFLDNKQIIPFKDKSSFKLEQLLNTFSTVENNTFYFEYENNLYTHNDIDTLGMVLGSLVISKKVKYVVVTIKKNNIPMYTLRVNRKEYQSFLETGNYHENLITFIKPIKRVNNKSLTTFKPLFNIEPSFIIVDGSEYAKYDYTIAIQPEVSVSLGKGTVISGRYYIPLAISDNFKNDGIFDYRNRNKASDCLDQILLSHFFKLDLSYPWMNSIQIGKFDNKLNGIFLESGITNKKGKDIFMIKVAYLDDKLGRYDMDRYYGKKRREKLVSYRHYLDKLNSNIKVMGGEFLYGDKGIELELNRFFSDTSLSLSLAYTEHDYRGINYLGKLVLSIPFGLNKRLNTKYIDIQNGYITYSRRKTLVSEGHASYAQPLHLEEINNHFTIENYYLDRDRFHPMYIKSHYNRLRNIFLENIGL